ncbi:unnamed protein product [Cylicocyclus nassatus]|uniref:C2H2-type domain-containing protein n=1 Tax=Cylicocyclus nassatus TaxID=53992 RepID=A0AA36HDZ5_CYLNA|nr:unnamed protein product [Cylicocyclus nassatus]
MEGMETTSLLSDDEITSDEVPPKGRNRLPKFIADSECHSYKKAISDGYFYLECPFSAKKSHYHCMACTKSFINLSEHSQQSCQTIVKSNGNKMVCSRPFCKLKKKQWHFHCAVCDQGFSERSKFQNHVGKHRITISKGPVHIVNQRSILWKREGNGETVGEFQMVNFMADVSKKNTLALESTRTSTPEDDSLPLDLRVKKSPAVSSAVQMTHEARSHSTAADPPFTLRRITFSL